MRFTKGPLGRAIMHQASAHIKEYGRDELQLRESNRIFRSLVNSSGPLSADSLVRKDSKTFASRKILSGRDGT